MLRFLKKKKTTTVDTAKCLQQRAYDTLSYSTIKIFSFCLQIEAIRRGLLKVLSQAVLDLLTWQELERRVCGDPDLAVEALKKCSECSLFEPMFQMDESYFCSQCSLLCLKPTGLVSAEVSCGF